MGEIYISENSSMQALSPQHPAMVSATPITELAFRPYGGLVAAGLEFPKIIKNGPESKSLEVVPSQDFYSRAPSQQPGRTVLHVAVVAPKALKINEGRRTLVLDRLERHPFTSQTFIPMGSDLDYLAIVADGNAEGTAPILETLKVFTVKEGQGVCYAAGVWHASLSVVGKNPITFAIVQSVNDVAEEDCEFHHIPVDKVIEINI